MQRLHVTARLLILILLIQGTLESSFAFGSSEFWKQVTNSPAVVQFQYSRSFEGASKPVSNPSTGVYVPTLVVFDVKQQPDGLLVRYSDKISVTNTYTIQNSFHFAVGGNGTNLWSLGATKQINYQSVTHEDLQLSESVKPRTDPRRSVSEIKSNSNPILQEFISHKRETEKVLHLGLPSIASGSLTISEKTFHAVGKNGTEITGNFEVDADARVYSLEYSINKSMPPRRINYDYTTGSDLPSAFREVVRADAKNGLTVVYRMLSQFEYPSKSFSAVELSPAAYLEANKDIRQFLRKDGKQFFLTKKGTFSEVVKTSTDPKKANKWMLLIFWGISLASIVVVVYKIKQKNI